MKGLSLVGALLGGLVGAGIWLVAIAVDGGPLGILALGVAAGVAAGAILLNSTPSGAIPAAVITLVFCGVAKFAGIPIALDRVQSSIKTTFEFKQYDLYMADAEAYSHMSPAQVEQWLQGRSPYDADRDGTISSSEREVFGRFWAPRLAQWAKNPPVAETWATQITQDWHKETGESIDGKGMAAEFLAPLQILFLILAAVGAHQAVARISLEEARERRRTSKITAGVIDLNEDIGSGVNIQMAAPGQKSARAPEVKPAAAKPAAAKPAPQEQDRPPGM